MVSNPLIFLHIQKTGGRTLEDILKRPYEAAGLKRFTFDGGRNSYEQFRQMPLEERDSFDLIDGHPHYGIHRWLSRPATSLTMLRDPVDRILSLYHYIFQSEQHYLYDIVVRGGISLTEFVDQIITAESDNGQVRVLNPEPLWEFPKGEVRRPMLEDAKRNLEHGFAAFGLTERFDESLVLFRRILGWHDVDLRYLRTNVTVKRPSRDEVDPAMIEIIRKHNQYDIELYEFARELYHRRVAALGDDFLSEVEAFQAANLEFAASTAAQASTDNGSVAPADRSASLAGSS